MTLTNAIITAYCACAQCCGPHHANITSSGESPTPNYTIAGPRNLPLGTRCSINGHTYVVQDRTAKRFDGRFDIYFASHADAIKFGRQISNVTILP